VIDRRQLVGGIAAGVLVPAAHAAPPAIGAWALLDPATGRVTGAQADVRVPMCSTFKWLLAACVLWHVDRGHERLDRPIAFGAADLLDHSPVVRPALAAGRALTVGDLCRATVTVSDNAAANLLLPRIGGPAGLTRWLRGQGDRITRLDRIEPALNHVPPGDPRDTTTAAAMLRLLDRLLYGPALAAASRAHLMAWLLACDTGATRLKAGLPAGWRIAHKTGTATTSRPSATDRNVAADVGVLLPPKGAPLLIAAWRVGEGDPAAADRWFADLARMAARRRDG
jgi:beta-lactamase class A